MSELARLLQLVSPALPVGAYSYSQGLEAAIEAKVVFDSKTAETWIGDVLELSVGAMDAPLLWRMLHGEDLDGLLLAGRETAELRAETVQMGGSLLKLLRDVGLSTGDREEISFPAAYALAARHWGIEPRAALVGYLWSWLENQVMAAVKAVPLGQTAGQKMLLALGGRLEAIADRAATAEPSNFAPALAILSSRHEKQYSRLFRS
jgi:urease accessory protein